MVGPPAYWSSGAAVRPLPRMGAAAPHVGLSRGWDWRWPVPGATAARAYGRKAESTEEVTCKAGSYSRINTRAALPVVHGQAGTNHGSVSHRAPQRRPVPPWSSSAEAAQPPHAPFAVRSHPREGPSRGAAVPIRGQGMTVRPRQPSRRRADMTLRASGKLRVAKSKLLAIHFVWEIGWSMLPPAVDLCGKRGRSKERKREEKV
uniref:Uncharacterized protein n=1 Tax=Setaria viridis TaxID=4556 RepID=A0A4U6WDE4_SETVI|nr:hypothetical protein SEVIR_1G155000v2 [Setaria viridis]